MDSAELKKYSKNCSDFYDQVHEVLQPHDNSLQSFRTTDIKHTHEDSIRDSSVQEGMKILDAGCGLGVFDFYLVSKMNCDVTAVTFSELELEKGKKLHAGKPTKGKLTYQLADFHFLKDYFPENTYDIVMFLESFEHVYDKEKVLRDCYSLLKPGGSLFIKYHFILWLNAKGREEEFAKSVQSETDSMRIFTHFTLPDFLKLTYEIGFMPLLVKIPSIQFDYYEASMNSVDKCNNLIEGFNYHAPNFQVTQCYNVLLKKL